MSVAGAVLAGGRSRRFGSDKALLLVAGETLLARSCRLLATLGPVAVIGRDAAPGGWSGPDASWIADEAERVNGAGPLMALAAALRWLPAAFHSVVVVPCDLPRLDQTAVTFLATMPAGSGGAVVVLDGTANPLIGRYHRGAATGIIHALAAGERAPRRVLAALGLAMVEPPADIAAALVSFNTPGEWAVINR